ncbi:MAG: hypothetical protein DME19_18390 [Verrucomicrobia bacterium]|nr:MAG: hypothetical protein DME19_18390 [Verrucomicrobiota bacterium]
MKKSMFFSPMALMTISLIAADSNPKDDVTSAAKKLGEKANYSWKTTVVVPESAQFRPGPTEGKTEKDGFTHVTMSFGDNTTQAVLKGDKAAVTNREGEWQSLADLDNAEGPGRFLGFFVRNIKTPAVQAADLAAAAKDLKKEGDAYSCDLTEEGAKTLLTFRPRGGGDGPTVSNAKGSVKFWLKEGELSKYEFKVTGKVSFNGNDRDVDRATTVEVKDVGTTKVEVPEGAKKKLS